MHQFELMPSLCEVLTAYGWRLAMTVMMQGVINCHMLTVNLGFILRLRKVGIIFTRVLQLSDRGKPDHLKWVF